MIEPCTNSQRRYKSRNLEDQFYSHRPTTNRISAILVDKDKSPHHHSRRNKGGIGKYLHNINRQLLESRSKKFVESKIKEEILMQKQCTFKPKILHSSKRISTLNLMDIDKTFRSYSSTSNLLHRLDQWAEYREKKIGELKHLSELEFRDTHTFAPKITSKL